MMFLPLIVPFILLQIIGQLIFVHIFIACLSVCVCLSVIFLSVSLFLCVMEARVQCAGFSSPPTTWILDMELRCSGLVASPVTLKTSHLGLVASPVTHGDISLAPRPGGKPLYPWRHLHSTRDRIIEKKTSHSPVPSCIFCSSLSRAKHIQCSYTEHN